MSFSVDDPNDSRNHLGVQPKSWRPRYVVRKAPGVGGEPIGEDEPVLVIRAQDPLAGEMLMHYFKLYVDEFGFDCDPGVLIDMAAHLQELQRWQQANSDKLKMADR